METELGMETQFTEKELGECLELVIDHRGKTPKKLGADWVDSGIPTISAKNVNGGRLVASEDIRFVTHDVYKRWMKEDVKRGDCFLVSEGATLGECMMWDHDYPVVLGQRIFCLRANPSVLYSRYLYAYMTSASFQSEIVGRATGTSVDGLRQTEVLKLKLRLPPMSQQRQIGDTLYSLDKKIELNRRMNVTLEGMARALFQSWFVDFDPVRAKLDGRKPEGMDKATAALFPDAFQESPIGNIPKGWNAIPLYDTAQWVNGAAFRSEDFCATGEGLPVIKIAELKDGISAQTKWCQRTAGPNQIIATGDLLYSWSGSPDTSLEAFLWSGGCGMLNQHIFKVISPTAAEKRFVYYLLHYLRPVLVETARNKQTTGLGHVTIADMKRLLVCLPSKAVLAAFDRNIAPIFDKAFNNTLESRTLATLRDTLLPKLLSGELSVASSKVKA